MGTLMGVLHARIARGEDFAKLAKRYSEDAESKLSGGVRPGSFDLESWPERVRTEIAKLEPGGTTPVLVLPGDRYYIFRLGEEKFVPFEEDAGALGSELESRRPTRVEIDEYVRGLDVSAKLVVRPEVARGLLDPTREGQ